MSEDLITKYLLERRLLSPSIALKGGADDEILKDEEVLARCAGLFDTFGPALASILNECVKEIASEMLTKSVPQEVPILRQVMVDVAAIYDRAQSYSIEYKKRQDAKESEAAPAGTNTEDNTAKDNAGDGVV